MEIGRDWLDWGGMAMGWAADCRVQGWDGMGLDGMASDVVGLGGVRGGWDGTEWQWDGMGWDGVGLGWNEVDIGRDWLELGWLGGCGLAWDRLAFAGFSLRSLWASGGERDWFLSFFKPLH